LSVLSSTRNADDSMIENRTSALFAGSASRSIVPSAMPSQRSFLNTSLSPSVNSDILADMSSPRRTIEKTKSNMARKNSRLLKISSTTCSQAISSLAGTGLSRLMMSLSSVIIEPVISCMASSKSSRLVRKYR
jgi:hypothetical protein